MISPLIDEIRFALKVAAIDLCSGRGQVPSGEDLPASLDQVLDELKAEGATISSERLDVILHGMAWTASSEMLGEIRLALVDVLRRRFLSTELQKKIVACIRGVESCSFRR